jgi:hypothetical protein
MLLLFDMKIPRSKKGEAGITVLGTLLVMVVLLITVVMLGLGLSAGALFVAGGVVDKVGLPELPGPCDKLHAAGELGSLRRVWIR